MGTLFCVNVIRVKAILIYIILTYVRTMESLMYAVIYNETSQHTGIFLSFLSTDGYGGLMCIADTYSITCATVKYHEDDIKCTVCILGEVVINTIINSHT